MHPTIEMPELDLFFQLSADLICIAGPDGYFHKVNPAWEKILGWTKTEMVSRPWIEWVHPEDVAATHVAVSQHDDTLVASCENRYRHKDGSYRWIAWRATHQSNGYSYCLGKDITEQKQSQQALQNLAAQVEHQAHTLEQILAATPDHIYMLDRSRRYIYASLAGAKALGLCPTDMIGKTWQELGLLPELMEPFEVEYQTVFATGLSIQNRAYLPTPEGSRYYEYALTPVRDPQGQITALVSTIRDITDLQLVTEALKVSKAELEVRIAERTAALQDANQQLKAEMSDRQQAEASLRDSEERFRQIFEHAPVGVALAKVTDYQFVMVNPAFCQLLGYSADELTQLACADVIHPEDLKQQCSLFQQVLQAEGNSLKSEVRYFHKDGHVVWTNLARSVIYSEAGEMIYTLGMVEDITERKQAEVEIRHALAKERELNELRSRFVTTVSHEFRTPLSVIILSTRLLERFGHQATEERKVQYLDRIRAAAQNMTHLLDDVLFIGKADAGKLQFQPADLDLRQLCQDLVEELQLVTPTPRALGFRYEGTVTQVYMDEKLLRQILMNLLSNAIKYTPADALIQFDVVCQTESVVFQIQDEGIGIPIESRQQLFESFHRADNVGTAPGTGLGLSIVKKCVDLHGGCIAVESEVGRGTTFTVTLPLSPNA